MCGRNKLPYVSVVWLDKKGFSFMASLCLGYCLLSSCCLNSLGEAVKHIILLTRVSKSGFIKEPEPSPNRDGVKESDTKVVVPHLGTKMCHLALCCEGSLYVSPFSRIWCGTHLSCSPDRWEENLSSWRPANQSTWHWPQRGFDGGPVDTPQPAPLFF